MQTLNLSEDFNPFIWPVAQPGHNTGRAAARPKHPRGRLNWPTLALSPVVAADRKDVFISTLAHELRQPLAVLRTTVDLVRLASTPAAAHETAATMERQIGRMSRLIEDLMQQTRWARQPLALRNERLDVCGLVTDALSDVKSAAGISGHQLVLPEMPERLWVYGDAHRLQQVLSNLLHNAMKFTDSGGRITVTVAREDASVTVRIADTGQGIGPEVLPYIFDLFSHVRRTDSEGVGIGLSVVREIVTLHRGRIDVRSEGLGRGSEFIVTLPLA